MSDVIQNLVKNSDPFGDFDAEDEKSGSATGTYVHIRIQQRSGRKSLTTVQGLPNDLDLKRILKYVKKTFNCNGTIVEDPELGSVIQLQGDQRSKMQKFLVEQQICERNEVKIHGF